MSQDINFLPKELRPLQKNAVKKDEPEVVLSDPVRDADRAAAVADQEEGGFLNRFRRHKNKSSESTVASFNITNERNELLAKIKNSSQSPVARVAEHSVSAVTSKPKQRPVKSFWQEWFGRKKSAPVIVKKSEPPAVSSAPDPKPAAPPPVAPAPGSSGRSFISTNLLKGQEFIFFNWQKAVLVHSIVIMLAIAVVAGVWTYAAYLQSRQSTAVASWQDQLSKQRQELAALNSQAAEFADLREKTKHIKNMLATHVYWTNFFNYLEANTLSGVYYADFEGDLSGVYELTARTRDFKTFVAQIKTWQASPEYTKTAVVQTMEVVAGQEGRGESARQVQVTEFGLDLSVDPAVFYK